ncbi:MAG: AI-2E family transporter [Deltaproteobacteria bacterium]|nr:AI-2E family transporter [Deltaproteobacteria bacterium]
MPELPSAAPLPDGSRDREFVVRAARWGIVAAGVLGALLLLLWVLKAALTPLAAAFVIAYLLDPLIDWFERHRVRRSFAIFLLLGLAGGGVLGFLLFVIPRVVAEISALTEQMPAYLERFVTEVVPAVEQRVGIDLPRTLDGLLGELRGAELTVLGTLRDLLTGTLATLTGTVGVVVGLLVIPILAYYLLVQFDEVVRRIGEGVPPRHRDSVFEKVRTIDRLVSGFLRGQMLVAATLGVLYAAGFSLIGIDLAIGVGLLAGALALVPYLGNIVALGTATVLCVLKFGIDGHLLAVIGWYLVVQSLEGFVLTPRIVGSSVGLHPAAVIVALLIGGDLFGFLGLLIAVPVAAVVKVFVAEALHAYRRSSLFGDDTALASAPPPLDEAP